MSLSLNYLSFYHCLTFTTMLASCLTILRERYFHWVYLYQVACNPENPCQNPDLSRVVRLLQGTLDQVSPDKEEEGAGDWRRDGEGGKSGEVFRRGQLFGEMASGEEVTSSTVQREEDVYEFKTSSKEATPTSSRGSASPGGGEGEKRQNEDEEETGNKKRKKEDAGRGRGVRGNSTEKNVGKQAGRGRGALVGGDRKSPPGSTRGDNSPAPSPGKTKQPKPDGGGESDEEGEKGKGEGGLKVPPLKIVLNSGNNSGGRDEDKKKTSYIVNANSEDGESSEGGKANDTENSATDDKTGNRVTRSRGGNTDEEGPSEITVEEERKQNEYHFKKRKMRNHHEEANSGNDGMNRPSGEPLTDIEKHLNIRKQIEQRRKNLFPVQPKPPQGFREYLMNKKTYHLQGNTGKDSRIQPIPKIAPPPSLEGPFRDLFLTQV